MSKSLSFEFNLPHPIGHLVVRDKTVGLNHRYAVHLNSPDFSKFDLLTTQEKTDAAAALATALDGKEIDPPFAPPVFPEPTALEAWEAEMLRLNEVIRDDFRYWEESAAGEISPTAAARMAAQVAAAKAHRASRPNE